MNIPMDDCGAVVDRTVNNKGRHQYRVLSDEEKRILHTLKDVGVNFCGYIEKLTPPPGGPLPGATGPSMDPRCAALAKTKMEEAVMWAVRGITK